MPLPLTVSCFIKTQIGFTFLMSADPGSPRQRALKRVCVSAKVVQTSGLLKHAGIYSASCVLQGLKVRFKTILVQVCVWCWKLSIPYLLLLLLSKSNRIHCWLTVSAMPCATRLRRTARNREHHWHLFPCFFEFYMLYSASIMCYVCFNLLLLSEVVYECACTIQSSCSADLTLDIFVLWQDYLLYCQWECCIWQAQTNDPLTHCR